MKTGKTAKIVRSEKGQISIMIGTMMLTFVVFFAFVINTGTLVNAKINLQNAADMAAYAGAATQARLMNQISFLNYQMREEYKKFLFRYYIIGNTSSGIIPPTSSTGTVSWTIPNATPGTPTLGVPAVCVVVGGAKDNPCWAGTLPSIPPLSSSSIIDPIAQELQNQVTQIEAIRQDSCGAIANFNQMVLLLWLFNTDPQLANLNTSFPVPGAQNSVFLSKSVMQGLGLVPRELILSERIKSLSSYLNVGPATKVSLSSVQSLKQGLDPASNERTIQAFLSAYYTLGTNMFAGSTITMDELLPTADPLFSYTPIDTGFDAYYVDYYIPPGGGPALKGTPCVPGVVPVSIPSVPVGVVKDPTIMTYYAVRVSATAQVLFNPFGPLTLDAYSAARPFGSRIGPTADSEYANFSHKPNSTNIAYLPTYNPNTPPKAIGELPDLIEKSTGEDWLSASTLSAMYNQMQVPPSSSGGAATYGPAQIALGIAGAQAPTLVETNIYNIPNDDGDPMVRYFDSAENAAFWAPIVTPANAGDLNNTLTKDLQAIMSPGTPGTSLTQVSGSKTPPQSGALATALASTLITYIGTLSSGGGENGEGINIVKITNPLHPAANPQSMTVVPGFSVTSPQQLKTSWNTVNDTSYRAAGRIGYSVKFVTLNSLKKPLSNDGNGSVSHKNVDFEDDTAKQEDTNIKH